MVEIAGFSWEMISGKGIVTVRHDDGATKAYRLTRQRDCDTDRLRIKLEAQDPLFTTEMTDKELGRV